ncbi:hypothetical protein HE1_00215 [Holospora elegans E1]|uniref:Uncharacterized protein n=2 Tax=Holospora TaxID=44747 RepID=A0A023DX43_9PROT|nr:hypothetical protein HE1_00215 [Holospora elegans E1]
MGEWLWGEVIGTTPAINIAKNTALHCAVYQRNPVKSLASQCLAEASLQGAGLIRRTRQDGSIDY